MDMNNTFTFTARDRQNPEKVVTLTLFDHHARVNITGMIDAVEEIRQAEEKDSEAGRQIAAQAVPAALKLSETISGPVQVNDLKAQIDGESMEISAWQRAAGLRLAPIHIHIDEVDNPEAAEAFVNELDRRQENAPQPGRFAGPLDYWIGWAGLALGAGLLFLWPHKSNQQH
jgi:cell pole-organizing protein PopZ